MLEPTERAPAPATPARILLAEDDAELRALLAVCLREDGHVVTEARDGNELLQRLAETAPFDDRARAGYDLIISDIRMPGYSGLEVVTAVRQMLWFTPVILITAFGEKRTHAQAERLGATYVFDKPFDIDDLRTAVVNLLTHPGYLV